MQEESEKIAIGDLLQVLAHYKEIIVATGIYLGLDKNEMYIKILENNGKIKEFDLTFYYLEGI